MIRYTFILILTLTVYIGNAQSNPLDSLFNQLDILINENPQESRQIIYEINKLAKQSNNPNRLLEAQTSYAEFYFANNLWQQANKHIDTALTIAKNNKNSLAEVELLVLLSKIYFKSGDAEQSQKKLTQALRIASSQRLTLSQVKIKLTQAEFKKSEGKQIDAIKIKKSALELALKSNDKGSQADCYQSIGSSYWQTGHYNNAIENYYKSLLIKEQLSDTLGIIQIIKNIGLAYRELGQYEKGLLNLERGLSLAEAINNRFEKADLLNITGSLHYRFNRFDEAIKFYTKSLEIRVDLKLLRSQITTHENLARAYAQKSNFEEALSHLNIALVLQEQIVDPIAESSTLTEMGNLNLLKGNVAEALRRYLMALKLRQTYSTDEDIAKSLTNIGIAYRRLGMYKSALKYLEQAHGIINAKELNINDASYILQNLGHIYQDQKEFSKAQTIYKEALNLKEQGGDESGTAKILKNIAQAQLQIKQINGARSSLAQALKIANRLNDSREIADIYNEMGNVERQANNLDIALKYFKNAADVHQSLSNFDGKALCVRKIGEIQIQKKQYSEAEQNINQSIKTGFQTGNAYIRSYGYLAKHDLYKAMGNYRLALENYAKHTAIKDSLENLKRNEANLEAQLDLELDQKKTEIKIMEAEVESLQQKAELDKIKIEQQKTFRNFLIAIVLLVITLAGAATYSFVQKKKYAKVLEEKIDEIKLMNDKLTASEIDLKNTVQTKDKLFSIIAHDLRSPFTALVGLSEVLAANVQSLSPDEIEELSKHINQSATGVLSLTDNLLNWSRSQTGKLVLNPKILSVKDIVDTIVEVASIPAKEKGIAIKYKLDPEITIYADYDTISTAIRNLVSNAIKFTPTGGVINIEAFQKLDQTQINVMDTGVGISPDNLSKLFRVDGLTTKGTNQESGTGLGLILCKEFVEKNNGTITVDSTPGLGTTFKIELPNITS